MTHDQCRSGNDCPGEMRRGIGVYRCDTCGWSPDDEARTKTPWGTVATVVASCILVALLVAIMASVLVDLGHRLREMI